MLHSVLLSVTFLFSSCTARDFNQAPFDDHRDYTDTLPVFPGAEGFGASTPAGRGGRVIRVTSLASDGPGSLREALAQPGPRVVVFDVAGVIDQVTPTTIQEPFVTVAGQTAPSPGITITGAGVAVMTHDVLIQHLRIRVGDRPDGPNGDARDSLGVIGFPTGTPDVFNIVISHCSLSWAIDENVSTWNAGVHDVTFRQCIIAEGLSHSLHPKGEHSKGLLIGDHSRRIAVIGNLFAHNTERNPLIKGDVSALVQNNAIYNPGRDAIHFSDPENSGVSQATIIGNILIPGPSTSWGVRLIHPLFSTKRGTVVFARDNGVLTKGRIAIADPMGQTDAQPVTVLPLTTLPSSSVTEWVLTHAGARPLDRDAIDRRIVQDVRDRTGRIIDSPRDVGGLPEVKPVLQSLVLPDNPDNDDDKDGYTNLEEWLHILAAQVDASK